MKHSIPYTRKGTLKECERSADTRRPPVRGSGEVKVRVCQRGRPLFLFNMHEESGCGIFPQITDKFSFLPDGLTVPEERISMTSVLPG